MPRLNQIIAIEKGEKPDATRKITDIHHLLAKAPLLSGISRTYRPKKDPSTQEEGDRLPSEETLVQVRATDAIDRFAEVLASYFDIVATKDWANCQAKADVVVDGNVLLKDVPITYLLWLEKRLANEIETFVRKLPVLDPSETWTWNDATNTFATKPTETIRTKKVMAKFEKAVATDKHPAQVEVFHEDVLVGYWTTIKFSGALPATRVREMMDRVEKLTKAVKVAREQANMHEAIAQTIGKRVLDFIFAK